MINVKILIQVDKDTPIKDINNIKAKFYNNLKRNTKYERKDTTRKEWICCNQKMIQIILTVENNTRIDEVMNNLTRNIKAEIFWHMDDRDVLSQIKALQDADFNEGYLVGLIANSTRKLIDTVESLSDVYNNRKVIDYIYEIDYEYVRVRKEETYSDYSYYVKIVKPRKKMITEYI